jgi:hypothetical protein
MTSFVEVTKETRKRILQETAALQAAECLQFRDGSFECKRGIVS